MELRDTLERAVATAAEVFLAALLASGANWFSLSSAKVAALAGLAAGLAVVKAYVKSKTV